ncbi:MAG: 5-formyltetrahydrofolate cyclo-ligase [Planctomycetota bacterium]|nr:5-formyltetrahydrofolate cyclo-ligase [Planctomycetota bacterium]
MCDATQNKKTIRSEMRSMLADFSDEVRLEASNLACNKLIGLDEFKDARVVLLYMPLVTEIDVTAIALRCFQMGKTVCVPKVDWQRKDMIGIEVNELDDNCMDVDDHGIRTPRQGQPVLPMQIDLVVVPGLAFDTKGHRLGRGGGFYDRYLARTRRGSIRMGICFDQQIVESVPIEPQDLPMDIVISDRRVSHAIPMRPSRHRR